MVSITELESSPTGIDGLHVLRPKQVTDDRGTVREFYRASSLGELGIGATGPWSQVNVTETRRGALRGMHGEAMTKLIGVVAGRAHGAWVDARPGSPTYGAVEQLELSIGTQVLVPPGVCNGFQALEDGTQYLYCFDAEWEPGMAGVAVTPLDPSLGIRWPIEVDTADRAMISAKDLEAPPLPPADTFGATGTST